VIRLTTPKPPAIVEAHHTPLCGPRLNRCGLSFGGLSRREKPRRRRRLRPALDEIKSFPSRRLAKVRRQIAVFDYEEPSRPCSFGSQKDVHSHLIRTLGKARAAHIPWRRMHGLNLNGFRWRVAHPNKHVVLLATGARKLCMESTSQQFGHHKMFSRGFRRNVVLLLPPIHSSAVSFIA
jgi:hypothetical protein